MSKKALGKGLSAIISSTVQNSDDEGSPGIDKDRIIEIDLKSIKSNPDQPRDQFSNKEIKELSESIKSVGLIQPVIVRKKNKEFHIVAGERRVRAAKLAGFKKIRAIVTEPTEEGNLFIALVENLQRKDLSPIEEARAYKTLMKKFKLKQQDIASRVGKERATVANSLRLLNLSKEIQDGLAEGRISAGHAKVLLSVTPQKQAALYKEVLNKGLSVRALEQITSDKSIKVSKTKKTKNRDPHIKKLEGELEYIFGTKVEIKHSKNRGKIEINYYSLDDFDRIVGLLK